MPTRNFDQAFTLLAYSLLLLITSLISTLTNAQPLSAFGTATIDGINTPGEWDNAAKRNVFSGPLLGSQVFVMNDATTLYIAYEILGDTALQNSDQADIRFDNTLDSVNTDNDDRATISQATYLDRRFFTLGGWSTNDFVAHGSGAAARSGSINFFEFSKPLSTGDSQDFDLTIGDSIGFCSIYFSDLSAGTPNSQLTAPDNCNLAVFAQNNYDQITIVDAPDEPNGAVNIPALSTFMAALLMAALVVIARVKD